MECLFCDFASGKKPCYKIWEDEKHMAFLSIYPNTEGFTVVIPKKHFSSYIFEQDNQVMCDLMTATKKVAVLLDKAFEDVGRTGIFFEGYGVDHLHSKLFPMHGTGSSSRFKPIASSVDKYFKHYEGYLSSHDYKREDERKLKELAGKILSIGE